MTRGQAYCCIEAILGLPLPKQATCLRLAAEASVRDWRDWCEQRGVPDYSGEFLDTFDRWLSGAASDAALDQIAKQFHEMLPPDLRNEHQASAYVGWALFAIALIALDQCKDDSGLSVHRNILHTGVCYAAAASCRNQTAPWEPNWVRLTSAELEFLDRWWRRCCEQFPGLVGSWSELQARQADHYADAGE